MRQTGHRRIIPGTTLYHVSHFSDDAVGSTGGVSYSSRKLHFSGRLLIHADVSADDRTVECHGRRAVRRP